MNRHKPSVRCVWVLSGAPGMEIPSALNWVPSPDKVVAADGGYALAARLGVVPDLIVGDFDSITPESLDHITKSRIPVSRYDHQTKMETDTELAALAALQWNPERIVILGSMGGRLDHWLANILLLTHPVLEIRNVTIVEGNQEVFLAKPSVWNEVSGQSGDIISLLPIGMDAEGVRNEGFEYPLVGETLLKGHGRGVSNVLLGDTGRVWFDKGTLLVTIAH